jgi:hypothetical protein
MILLFSLAFNSKINNTDIVLTISLVNVCSKHLSILLSRQRVLNIILKLISIICSNYSNDRSKRASFIINTFQLPSFINCHTHNFNWHQYTRKRKLVLYRNNIMVHIRTPSQKSCYNGAFIKMHIVSIILTHLVYSRIIMMGTKVYDGWKKAYTDRDVR